MKFSRPLILLALTALLPLILLSAGIGAAWLRQQQAEMERSAMERVQRASGVLDRELAGQTDLLRVLAQSPVLDGPLNPPAVRAMLERARDEVPLWRFLSLSDREGNRLIDTPEPVSGGPGRVVEMDSHIRAVATGKPMVGAVARGPNNNVAFAIRVPVVRGGQVTHVLSAVVNPEAINRLLRAVVPDGWRGSVIDTGGRLVSRTFGDQSFITQPASAYARAALARSDRGIYESISLEGDHLIVAYHVLPTWNWSVHVAIPRELYRVPFVNALWLLMLGGTVSLLLAGLFVALLGREAEARRRAEAAMEASWRMEALGRMTGGIAHDFNNLLMIAQGAAEAIKRRVSDPERVLTFADAVLTAVQRGETLTRQLLAFARRSPQDPVRFRLQERAGDLLPLLEHSVRSDMEVSLAVPEETWPVFADPNALEVALVNLAVNARDAMTTGGRLTVTAANATLFSGRDNPAGLAGDFVAIRVEDTGSGIAKENLGRIFEPFFTTKAVGKGTGLGLSQVMGFARQSGGGVSVESQPGVGTAITLYLPRGIAEPETDGGGGSLAPAAAVSDTIRSGEVRQSA